MTIWEKRQNFHAEKYEIFYFTWTWSMILNPILRCGLCIMVLFQSVWCKGKSITLWWKI